MASTRIQLPSGLEKAGFTVAQKPKYKRIIMNVQAREGCGKTRFALTAPAPIAYVSLEYGLEGVIDPWVGKKTIWPAFFKTQHLIRHMQESMTLQEWAEELERVEKAMIAVLDNDAVRTVVLDTGTEHWELVRLGEFGKVSQVMPEQYGPANRRMRGLIEMAYQRPNLNLIVLSKLGKQYMKKGGDKRGDWNGEWEIKGWSDLPYTVQVNVVLSKEWNDDTERNDFVLRFAKIRQDAGHSSESVELRNEEIDFPNVAMLVHPDSSPEDWDDVG